MVVAGIFALLMRSSTWLAFIFDDIVAMFSDYAHQGQLPQQRRPDHLLHGLCAGLLMLSLLYRVIRVLTHAMAARAFGGDIGADLPGHQHG